MLQSDSRGGKRCRKSWRGSSARIRHMDANRTLDLSLCLQHLKMMDDMFHHILHQCQAQTGQAGPTHRKPSSQAATLIQEVLYLCCKYFITMPAGTNSLLLLWKSDSTSLIWWSSISVTFCACSVTTPFYSCWFASPILFFCTNSLMSSLHLQM